ncbi:UNVERIFIED_CONTAM: O-antigen ligase family protein [Actinomycetes bacterium ARC8]|nr:O-antigen ligase family protein [Actinomycetes bacterium ARC8]
MATGTWAPDTLVILAGALPLLVAPVAYYALPPRPHWQGRLYIVLMCATAIFAVSAVVDGLLTPWGEQPTLLGHEKAYLAVVLIGMPNSKTTRICKLLIIVGLCLAFTKYPSATTGFVLIVSALCFWLIRAETRASRNIRFIFLLLGFAVLSTSSAAVIAAFYRFFGRGDNTDTRLGLWEQALQTVTRSPWVGSAASEPITGLANIRGIIQPVPYHNSYLSLAACCGLTALLLFACSVVFAVLNSLSLTRVNREYTQLWLPALMAGLITMSVNPVLEKLGTALPLYALLLCGSISSAIREKDLVDVEES